ncbi:MAG: hypothetical protein LUG65_01905, partial [Clostridiales bacterium]|nr:hypothetical protein [Clostridiales bacterium]
DETPVEEKAPSFSEPVPEQPKPAPATTTGPVSTAEPAAPQEPVPAAESAPEQPFVFVEEPVATSQPEKKEEDPYEAILRIFEKGNR